MAVLGAGNMGAALIGGVLKAGVVERENLTATVRGEGHAGDLAGKFGIAVTAGRNREAAQNAEIVVLAVKPSTVPQVMREIREELNENQVLISLAASLPISAIERLAGRSLSIFRAMPNIPVVVEEGAIGLTCNGRATAAQRDLVERIFRAVGVVCFVEEDLMDAVTALSGSGPAYVYMVIEALIAGGVKMGLSRETSTRLAEQTVLGAAKLVRETMLHPAILRDQVITPGGVTIAAIHELEKHGLRSMLISAVETATRTSRDRTRILLEKLEHHE